MMLQQIWMCNIFPIDIFTPSVMKIILDHYQIFRSLRSSIQIILSELVHLTFALFVPHTGTCFHTGHVHGVHRMITYS